mmetsp:Transcript_9257/g.20699  ORF Transcript_9257/g.20699 Transcript_9257/m.20699 type:complete len:237 (-) Transcript_9257:225-935(-)
MTLSLPPDSSVSFLAQRTAKNISRKTSGETCSRAASTRTAAVLPTKLSFTCHLDWSSDCNRSVPTALASFLTSVNVPTLKTLTSLEPEASGVGNFCTARTLNRWSERRRRTCAPTCHSSAMYSSEYKISLFFVPSARTRSTALADSLSNFASSTPASAEALEVLLDTRTSGNKGLRVSASAAPSSPLSAASTAASCTIVSTSPSACMRTFLWPNLLARRTSVSVAGAETKAADSVV